METNRIVTTERPEEQHTLIKEGVFRLKSFLLTIKRQFKNISSPLKKFRDHGVLIDQPVISVSASDLWNKEDHALNRILTAGKVQNLRVAVRELNGIEIPADTIFSFWKQLGRPTATKGYTTGREIREGCIIPSIGGGLCQLSNALYDAAMQAGFEITERHKHTKIIKGSLAEQDRDAVVKWSYVDLRFKSAHAFRLEAELTSEQLIVRFKSGGRVIASTTETKRTVVNSSLNDCYSCGNTTCFKYPRKPSYQKENGITTFVLDEKWTEYNDYVKATATNSSVFIVPFLPDQFIKTDRYHWTIGTAVAVKTLSWTALRRAVTIRLISGTGKNVFSMKLQLDKKIARAAAKKIPVESTHLVISQNLLPFLMEEGVLGGRTFDVLMNGLPLEKIHEQLDFAYSLHPGSKTLNDLRAPQYLTALENNALTKSRYIITPHAAVADLFQHKSIRLHWNVPAVDEQAVPAGVAIFFPGSALGRKGAYEVRRLAKDLNLCVVITETTAKAIDFWKDVQTKVTGNRPFDIASLVVYPAYVEHQPRLLLKALAAGIPVITTSAAGLSPRDQLQLVPAGDYEALKKAVCHQLKLFSTVHS